MFNLVTRGSTTTRSRSCIRELVLGSMGGTAGSRPATQPRAVAMTPMPGTAGDLCAAETGATLPSVFPALLKPNYGDSSQGITKGRGGDQRGRCSTTWSAAGRVPAPADPAGVPDGAGIFGEPYWQSDQGCARCLSSRSTLAARPQLAENPRLWEPDSPTDADPLPRANLPDHIQSQLVEHSARMFELLGCRDYARFDFRADANGEIKLLEVNPNPGWCWDGKLNIMAGFQGMRYAELLGQILTAAEERLGIVPKPHTLAVGATPNGVHGTVQAQPGAVMAPSVK